MKNWSATGGVVGFFFSSRRRHTRCLSDWSSDVCSSDLVQGAKLLKERGVEIVDINDGSLGRVRMAVLPTALLVREATGLDINMHFTCRDRNLMGIQADLLGAHALDVRNILALRGDPPRAGDYVNTTAVFDVNAIGLIEVLKRMNQGMDATGNGIGEPTS